MQTLNRLFRLLATLSLLLLPVQPPVHAGALLLAGVSQTVGGGVAGPAITFIGCTASSTDLTTYTFAAHNVGTASADRITIVGVGAEDALSAFGVSTVTVNGDSATEYNDNGGTDVIDAAFYTLANPAGTAEDIVVTFSEAVSNAVVCVWAATGISAIPYSWVVDTETINATTLKLNHFVYGGGVSAGICITDNQSTSFTWVGLTERADAQPGESGYTAADYTNGGTADSPLTATCVSAVGKQVGSIVSFRASAPADPSRTFVACTTDTGAASTYPFLSVSLSTAADNRLIVVGVLGLDPPGVFNVTSMTIGGVSAAKAIDEDGTGDVDSAIFYLAVPTGTTATVSVTFSEAIQGAVICVWALYDIAQLYPFSTATDDDAGGAVMVVGHVTLTKGISVGVCAGSLTAGSFTWVGLTEIVDSQADFDYTAADLVEDAGTPLSASCDISSSDDTTVSVAHWR